MSIARAALLATLFLPALALAQGAPEKAASCAACHGAAGISSNPEWPNLAGQHASYTALQLAHFRDGKRKNDLMSAMATGLTDEDIRALGNHFAAQPPVVGTADEALVAAGAALYRGGNKATGVPACMACHGPRGAGNPGAAYPALSGQHATYTARQLEAYRSGARSTDPASIMRAIAARMTAEEIAAVASYVAGLH